MTGEDRDIGFMAIGMMLAIALISISGMTFAVISTVVMIVISLHGGGNK